MIKIPQNFLLHSKNTPFPQINSALTEPNGLVAVGGELSKDRLLDAYKKGIFPWYNENEPILWYSPDPRMVITPDKLHISKSLQKTLSTKPFEIRINTNFAQVIKRCSLIKRKQQQGTWINKAMIAAYINLHQQGIAHSLEAYQNQVLVGGLYGVGVGKVFFGESMFADVNNASKAAFVYLLQKMPYQLIDCQVESPHLKSLGAFNMRRDVFVQQLRKLL